MIKKMKHKKVRFFNQQRPSVSSSSWILRETEKIVLFNEGKMSRRSDSVCKEILQESNLSLILINLDVSFKDQNVDIFCKTADASEFRLSQKTNPEEKQKITNAKFTCNFWRKISFKEGNGSAHLSRVFNLVYMRVGL